MKFFIVGSGRCGSTLLCRMLNRHPDLWVFNETHWIPKLHEFFGTGHGLAPEMLAIVDNTFHVNGVRTTPLPESLRAAIGAIDGPITVRQFVDMLGNQVAAENGKRLWADKTPDYCCHLGLLQSHWPEARFLHLIRDGMATSLSMKRHPGYRHLVATQNVCWTAVAHGPPMVVEAAEEAPIAAALRLWRLRVSRARDEASRLESGSYLEVRYESLCAEPVGTLRGIADFLRLEKGPWIAEAATLVDPTRGRPPHLPDAGIEVDRLTVALMRELGYGASLCTASEDG